MHSASLWLKHWPASADKAHVHMDALIEIRQRIHKAIVFRDAGELQRVESEVQIMPVPELSILASSGLVDVMRSPELSTIAGGKFSEAFAGTLTKWIPSAPSAADAGGAQELALFLRSVSEPKPSYAVCMGLAQGLLTLDFTCWRDLPGARATELAEALDLSHEHLHILQHAIATAEEQYRVTASSTSASSSGVSQLSAEDVASFVAAAQPGGQARDIHADFRTEWRLQSVGSSLPRTSIAAMASALDNGLALSELRQRETTLLMCDAAPKSLPQIASALRCWHSFAIQVLGMAPDKTFPPLSDDDVILYVCIFRNSGTCSNYVSALRFGCRLAKQSTSWDTERLSQALRGVQRRTLQQIAPRRRIGRALLRQVIMHATAEGCPEEASVYAFSFVFLLRVENECLPLEAGHFTDSDTYLHQLPPGRHSAVWCDQGELVMRLASRKNRQSGTVLRRGCLCFSRAAAADLCPVHQLAIRIHGLCAGQQLFPYWAATGGAALRASLRRRLTLLGVPDAMSYGLQSLRRGHAQQIVDDGGSLADVLRAGQWSSPAFMLYLDMAEVESAAVIDAMTGAADGADDV